MDIERLVDVCTASSEITMHVHRIRLNISLNIAFPYACSKYAYNAKYNL